MENTDRKVLKSKDDGVLTMERKENIAIEVLIGMKNQVEHNDFADDQQPCSDPPPPADHLPEELGNHIERLHEERRRDCHYLSDFKALFDISSERKLQAEREVANNAEENLITKAAGNGRAITSVTMVGVDLKMAFGRKDLMSKDDGSFDRMMEEEMEAANGDQSVALEAVHRRVVISFTDKLRAEAALKINIPTKKRSAMKRKPGTCFHFREPSPDPDPPLREELKNRTERSDGLLTVSVTSVTNHGDTTDNLCFKIPTAKRKSRTFFDFQVPGSGTLPSPADHLPEEFRNRIERLNGTDVTLVIQKQITATDLKANQNRLSIPRMQIRNEFLTHEEKDILDEKGAIKVSMIQPCLEETENLELKKWKMNKSFLLTLIGEWSAAAKNKKNRLEVNSMIQLWSFRKGYRLCFALVKP